MISLLAALIVGASAHASPASEHLAAMARASELRKVALAYEFCLNSIGATDYRERILALGEAWKELPEDAYLTLDTCQTMWVSRHLDPMKTLEIRSQQDLIRINDILASEGLLGLPRYLSEGVTAFLTTKPRNLEGLPPAPFEILSGLASSERQLDTALSFEQRQLQARLASTGVLSAGLLAELFGAVKGAGLSAGRLVRHFLLISAAAWGAERITDAATWDARRKELRRPVYDLMTAMLRSNSTPSPMLLDQFYKATELLGYFYSHALFEADSGQPDRRVFASAACVTDVRDYFQGRADLLRPLIQNLVSGEECADPASVWLGAGLYLQKRYPQDAHAQRVAERLIARSKRTLQLYVLSEALLACDRLAESLRIQYGYVCDPASGKIQVAL